MAFKPCDGGSLVIPKLSQKQYAMEIGKVGNAIETFNHLERKGGFGHEET